MTETQSPPRLEVIQLSAIKPNPDQPRKDFDDTELERLTESIKQVGVLTPISVRPNGKGYYLVAGERRVRAAKAAGLKTIPAIVRDTEQSDASGSWFHVEAIVENVQRADLNVIEEGDAYIALSKTGLSVDDIAKQVSRTTERVAQRMGLAQLPEPARAALVEGRMGIGDALGWVPIALKAPAFAAAVAAVAAKGGWWNQDPDWVWGQMNRFAEVTNEEECSECDGTGEAADESGDDCPACGGAGTLTITDEASDDDVLPEFFAWPLSDTNVPLPGRMVEQLTQGAQDRLAAARARAQQHFDEKSKASSSYFESPPAMTLHNEELLDVAVNGGFGFEIAKKWGGRRVIVTDPAFVSEYLPDLYEADVERYVSSKTGRVAASGSRGGVKKLDEMTEEEKQEHQARVAERQEAVAERSRGREFNVRLGVAIAQNLGEVEVTTEAMKLLVKTILRETESHDYRGIQGEGHALFHKLMREDWPAAKNGDWKLPRSAEDRAAFVAGVYKQAYKELGQAKTPEQALAVLIRFLAPGLADLRGLPLADLDKMYPYNTEADAWRKFVKARLPKPVASKAPPANGVKGRSQAWG